MSFVFDTTLSGEGYKPFHPVGFSKTNGSGSKFTTVQVLSDTGATYTTLQLDIAKKMGIDLQSGRTVNIDLGSGSGLTPFFRHNVWLTIGNLRPVLTVADFGPVRRNVLGKHSLNMFTVRYQWNKITYIQYTAPAARAVSAYTYSYAYDSLPPWKKRI